MSNISDVKATKGQLVNVLRGILQAYADTQSGALHASDGVAFKKAMEEAAVFAKESGMYPPKSWVITIITKAKSS